MRRGLDTTRMMVHMNIMVKGNGNTKEFTYIDLDVPEWFDDNHRQWGIRTEFMVNSTDVTLWWYDCPFEQALPKEENLTRVHDAVANFIVKLQHTIASQN